MIEEKAIPSTAYENAKASRVTIPVRPDPEIEVPVEADQDKVVPLSREVYEKMSPMMQKLTLMDKVVVITG